MSIAAIAAIVDAHQAAGSRPSLPAGAISTRRRDDWTITGAGP